ncbi:MAG: NAD(P)/FAD-dependent oxidoreductase [Dehalococcoidales bacterium]|nr:NAD(P)/FAD-dependent oxidoreductase [Dehalococcoidales bacterium]
MLDVAVIGGGPVGSRLAFKLSSLGRRVAVLEKNASIGGKRACTGIISRECAARFAVPSHVIFRQLNSAKIFSPSGEYIRLYRPDTQACIVDRIHFDTVMAETAQSSGALYQLKSKAENIRFHQDRAVIEIDHEGQPRSLEAKIVVLATGFNAALVKRLGLGQPGYLVAGAQIEVGMEGTDEVEVYLDQKLAPDFFAWLAPTANGRALAGLMTRQSPGFRLREWLARLKSAGKVISEAGPIYYGGIPLKPLPRTSGERLIVVGDAAGQVKPTTGGGLYFGMLCADIAADVIQEALENRDCSAKMLSKYETEWREKLGHELKIEYTARRMYKKLSNPQIDRLVSAIKNTGLVDSLLLDDSLSFDWHGGLMLKALKAGVKSQVKRVFNL